jgi:hypothetical protein
LPKLTGSIVESFRNSEYSEVTFKAGTRFVRSEAWNSKGAGAFLGIEGVDSAGEAEQAYNLVKWNNPREVLRTYVLTKDTTMYFGSVARGEGYQALVPEGIVPSSILRLVSARPLG